MTDATVSHRSRPLRCIMGLHRAAWVWDPFTAAMRDRGRPTLRVCGDCGTMLHGDHWDTVAPLAGAAQALRPAVLALAFTAGAASAHVLRAHRRRR